MDNIITRYISLPTTIKAMTVRDMDGDYNIYLNQILSYGEILAAYKHEMNHIRFGDFDNNLDIRLIEERADS